MAVRPRSRLNAPKTNGTPAKPRPRASITPAATTALPAVQRSITSGITVEGSIPPDMVIKLQQVLGNQAVRALLGFDTSGLDADVLAAEAGAGEPGKVEFTQEEIDQIVSEMIAETLEAYNNIPVVVKEERPLPAASGSATAETAAGTAPEVEAPVEPAPTAGTETEAAAGSGSAAQEPAAPAAKTTETVTKKVKVRAVYYINSDDADLKETRKAAGFFAIAGSLGDQISELNGKDGRLSAGSAVKIGKSSPEDLGLFINQAVASGSISQYGRQEGALGEGDLLVDLGDEALQKLIQDWMYHVKAGVDCSGMINIALVRAREKVRDQMREAGVPEEELPRSLARQQRPHKGKEVTKASELRPGDIWVTNEGQHVRLVMDAYESTNKSGKPVIEFTTAESATAKGLGPTDKKWRTASLSQIQDIVNIAGKGPADGKFFRVKEVRKKKE